MDNSISRYHFTKLNKKEQMLYNEIYRGWASYNFTIRLDYCLPFSWEEFKNALEAIRFDCPNIYYFDIENLTLRSSDITAVHELKKPFNMNALRSRSAALEKKLKQICAGAVGYSSPLDRLRYAYDYLLSTVSYQQYPSLRCYSADGALLDGTAVCQGIASALKLLCDRLHIASIHVTGKGRPSATSPYEAHSWNIVRLGGSCYLLDATWDCIASKSGTPSRLYFCGDEQSFMRDHQWDRSYYPACPQALQSPDTAVSSVSSKYELASVVASARLKGEKQMRIRYGGAYTFDSLQNDIMGALRLSRYNGPVSFQHNTTQQTVIVILQ